MDRESHWNCWKLECTNGRQVWKFDPTQNIIDHYKDLSSIEFLNDHKTAFEFDSTFNPNSGDKVYRNLKAEKSIRAEASSAEEAHKNAILFYKQLQDEDGHWPGDYGGPLFLLPGLIVASKVTGKLFTGVKAELMKQYIFNHQNGDGGWGLHIEDRSTMMGTVMQYVALRLLGIPKENERIESARKWILLNGGATGIPSWGKFYLAVLGIFHWDGMNSLIPEMWLLPSSLPVHPSNYWCHCRMVYLPMAYCYGHRITADEDETIRSLREEIYTTEYSKIKWSKVRNEICKTDEYHTQSTILKILNDLINLYEGNHIKSARKKALGFIESYIDAEDEQTNFIDIGPVNQAINSIAVWHAKGEDSNEFKNHVARWDDYLWLAEDGMKMSGYNGSQLWDTTFAVQAILENPIDDIHDTLQSALNFIDQTQIREEVKFRDVFFRHKSKGGWPFSTLDHGWPIADCTSEGLKASILIQDHLNKIQIEDKRLEESIDLILSYQNQDGGWATYENKRAGAWLEILNPSEIFSDIMVDYSWTECTSACIQALSNFIKKFPNYRSKEILKAVDSGLNFILEQQRSNGSWIGGWAVCFTYATWFGMEAIAHCKEIGVTSTKANASLKRAKDFLLSKQNVDGGWGESYLSCVNKEYTESDKSQNVNTAWSLLALMVVENPPEKSIEKGIAYLIKKQNDLGDWEQEAISGVFNFNCMITYTSYRNVFPIWALGRYLKSRA